MRKLTAIALAWVMMFGALSACGAKQEEPVTRQIIAMDTAMSFSVYGEKGNETVQAAVEEIQRLEKLMDRTDENSMIAELNHAEGRSVQTGEEICSLIRAAQAFSAATAGAFDITIAPVVSAWGFTEGSHQVPEKKQLEQLLTSVGSNHVTLTEDTVTLTPGTQIDLGGIAKGYASDRLAELFAQQQTERGWVSLGGNVLAWGDRPDGSPWKVGIQDPKQPTEEALVGMVGLENAYAVTSGGYQRFFEEHGKIYHHIIDPATGYPADSGLTSVTVVAGCEAKGNGTMCDALSTALFIMGEEKALDFWRSSQYDFDLVLVTDDDRVLVTAGIADQFTEAEGSGYTYETVG